jgi:hypothetical protein
MDLITTNDCLHVNTIKNFILDISSEIYIQIFRSQVMFYFSLIIEQMIKILSFLFLE